MEAPAICTGAAEQDASVMVAGTEQTNVMVPVNPLTGDSGMVAEPDCPAVTVTVEVVAADNEKS